MEALPTIGRMSQVTPNLTVDGLIEITVAKVKSQHELIPLSSGLVSLVHLQLIICCIVIMDQKASLYLCSKLEQLPVELQAGMVSFQICQEIVLLRY